MREFEVLGEYSIYLDDESDQAIVGRVHHFTRNEDGGVRQVPVAHLVAHLEAGDDLLRPHWAVHLFLRSDVRYDPATRVTTVVANPERQAGPNRSMLRRLKRLRDSRLPFYHPELPREVGELLLREAACSEPTLVNVHHAASSSLLTFGEVVDHG